MSNTFKLGKDLVVNEFVVIDGKEARVIQSWSEKFSGCIANDDCVHKIDPNKPYNSLNEKLHAVKDEHYSILKTESGNFAGQAKMYHFERGSI